MNPRARMTVGDREPPNIGHLAVYSMLEQGTIPGVRLGRRWIITRQA